MIKFPVGKLLQLQEQLEESLMKFLWEADSDMVSRELEELEEEGLEFDVGNYINTISVATSKGLLYTGLIAYHTYYESHMVLVDMFELCILGNTVLDNRSSKSIDFFSRYSIAYLPYRNEGVHDPDYDSVSLKDFIEENLEGDLPLNECDYKTLVRVLINKSVLRYKLSFMTTSPQLGISKELSILLSLEEEIKKDIELMRELRIKRLKSVYDSPTY